MGFRPGSKWSKTPSGWSQKFLRFDADSSRELAVAVRAMRPLWVSGLAALLCLTGARVNEVLPNSKYKTFMVFAPLEIQRGRYVFRIPLTEKRNTHRKKKGVDAPVKTKIELRPRIVPLPHGEQDREFFESFLVYLQARGAPNFLTRGASHYRTMGAGFKTWSAQVVNPKADLSAMTRFQRVGVSALRSFYWLYSDKEHLKTCLFPFSRESFRRHLGRSTITMLDANTGMRVKVRVNAHLLRKWRVSNLVLEKGFDALTLKAWIGWKDHKSMERYIIAPEAELIDDKLSKGGF